VCRRPGIVQTIRRAGMVHKARTSWTGLQLRFTLNSFRIEAGTSPPGAAAPAAGMEAAVAASDRAFVEENYASAASLYGDVSADPPAA